MVQGNEQVMELYKKGGWVCRGGGGAEYRYHFEMGHVVSEGSQVDSLHRDMDMSHEQTKRSTIPEAWIGGDS